MNKLNDSFSKDRLLFWEEQAKKLHWFQKWDNVLEWNKPYAKWFQGGKINASYNCLDIHLQDKKNKTAIIWEGESGEVRTFTYETLHKQVNKLAHTLQNKFNIKKGDFVTLYMPMIPELAIAILACARIGAIHNVIQSLNNENILFESLKDSDSKLLISADGYNQKGEIINLRKILKDSAINELSSLDSIIIVNHIGKELSSYKINNEYDYHQVIENAPLFCEPEKMESEDPLFILYKPKDNNNPKGILHSTGGYLTQAKYSTELVFDLKDNDILWCTSDMALITGHTYVLYGPLANGSTVFIYEGTPDYPDKDRYWDIIDRHKISIFYTSPTSIQTFMKWGKGYIKKHNISSLRLLGTISDLIHPEVWTWYHKNIGKSKCPIIDTWWQPETGGIVFSNLPTINDMKMGYNGMPLPGIDFKIINKDGTEVNAGKGEIILTNPWPAMFMGIWKKPQEFENNYWNNIGYRTGETVKIDKKGYMKLAGRSKI